jgi:hypothetical protein
VSYVWNPDSPAWRLFGTGPGGDPVHTDEQSRLLGTFARAVIRARPGRYAALVATDFGRYFVPGVGSRGTSDTAIHLPTHPWEIVVIPELRDRFLPGYTPEIRTGSKPLRAVADVLHTPRWLMGLLAIAALVAVLRGGPHRREIVLLTGAGLLMPLGAAATSDMVVRYLLPSVPLLVAGGVLALEDLRASRA